MRQSAKQQRDSDSLLSADCTGQRHFISWFWNFECVQSATDLRKEDYEARSQKCDKQLLATSCLSVRMEQLGSHWTDFHKI
jgi:hypothetical protein